ncbi:N-acetyl-alpha-D-glucosaminyl L-malate synthase BshA [Kyrpidia spormannii]|uniref:N-acetyl-alpha-D-glucosaminyl L-malate synthase n=2 Tax=Kyrpidia spormannii TaxID=2055160 RepID=A0ACA8ZDZ2_9BACL|nr:N-acetyl-alpha-D-glucosaminyl L-malate synthase BshA [Kyrpidia spormannii]CAB3395474.1 N-acetyl-alpha-D-glucosaminyl L-malate synthase [Kyrpidia spormannii]CAB3396164.1 N-acetyl-alpha-D-glucosaminyl L-malate synthase [Kyrpidia spormannii]
MRIAIACHSVLGGSGALAVELARSLAHKGHEVHVISDGVPFRFVRPHEKMFLHMVELPQHHVFRYPPFEMALAGTMAELMKKYFFDILHVHYVLPFAISAYLARQMVPEHSAPVVTTLHGTDITQLSRDKALFAPIRLGIEKSDAVTAVSASLAAEAMRIFSLKKDIAVIHNYVDTSRYIRQDVTELRRQYADPDEPILMHISNFRPIKRVPDVIRVFAEVRRRRRAKLALVGEGPGMAEVHALVREKGLEEDVHFLGKRSDVEMVLSMADVLLLPSEQESFGLAAVEAMACETPVVASRTGGLPEVIVHGETGFLAEVGDVSAMADYVSQLLDDRALHRAFAAKGRGRVERYFSCTHQVQKYEELYRQVLENQRMHSTDAEQAG